MNSRSEYNFKKFNLYVHEKGDFWPKEYFFPISIPPGDYKVFSFSMKMEYKVLLLSAKHVHLLASSLPMLKRRMRYDDELHLMT